MNVVIVAPGHVPLVIGGAEKMYWGLLEHLNRHTEHQADIIKVPSPERNFWEVVESYQRFSNLDLTPYEVIISSKYPAWMPNHPNHVCYMQHPLRGLYDTYPGNLSRRCKLRHPEVRQLVGLLRGTDHSREALSECFARIERLRTPSRPRRFRLPVPAAAFAFPGPLIREIVHFCDRVALQPAAIRRYCAISATVAGRDGYFPPGVEVTPVHHPSDLSGFHRPRRGRYLFTVSRLDHPKRIDLLIEAMRHVRAKLELWIAGTGPDGERLRELAGGDSRIKFLGFVNNDALLELYAHALAVLFVPYQEDFGLVALEAMNAAKPVIITTDAGGAVELVVDGDTGYVTDPKPRAIGAAIERLASRRRRARRMGQAGHGRAREVTWGRVCATLLDGFDT